MSEAAKEANKSINKIRQVVKRAIAHIKSWRIFHTDYCRPLHTFEQTITAALSLHAFKTTLRITFNLKEFESACSFQRAPELSRSGPRIEGARLVSHYEHSREGRTQLLNLPTFCRRVDQET